jgi:hypothetical protein
MKAAEELRQPSNLLPATFQPKKEEGEENA